jgi:hypothetical protein
MQDGCVHCSAKYMAFTRGHLMGPGVHLLAHLITSSLSPTGGFNGPCKLTPDRITGAGLLLIFVTLYRVISFTSLCVLASLANQQSWQQLEGYLHCRRVTVVPVAAAVGPKINHDTTLINNKS